MALKDDLQTAFEENLSNGGEISDIAQVITDIYEGAVGDGKDSNGNTWTGINYPSLKSAIIAQLNISFNTSTFLQFTLIEASLIAAWAPAIMSSLKPHPSQSVVTTGLVTISTPVGVPPLVSESDGYDNIVDAFYDVFTKHAKTLTFTYIGIARAGSPPPPLVVPVSSFTIK